VVFKGEDLRRPAGRTALRKREDPEPQRRVPGGPPNGYHVPGAPPNGYRVPGAPPNGHRPLGRLEPGDATLDLTDRVLTKEPDLTDQVPASEQLVAYRRHRTRRKWNVAQVVGGLLIAGACVAAVMWYVPRVVSTDRRMLTGSVTSSGVVTLNFQKPGILSVVKVQPDQAVHKGQVLATEYAPNATAIVAADKVAITAVLAKIAELKDEETLNPLTVPADQAQIASENAQMATDQATLDTDRMNLAATEIVAPASGVIVAANGELGEAVTSSGIRDYASSSGAVEGQQQPQFSLLPEGPQSTARTSGAESSLPVIVLRVSSSWSVVALVPENSVSSINAGQPVTVSVPAARIYHVQGQIQEVMPEPVASSTGPLYQVMISITGSVPNPPLDGMAANVELRH
jgi:multidrug resistance efflux pump